MNSKTKGKARPQGKMPPSDAPLATMRPALLAELGLEDGIGIKAKAIDELRTATKLVQDPQSSANGDELKINTILAHITNAVILAGGTSKGRIWLEEICGKRGQSRRTHTSILLLTFKAFGPYDRSEQKRRQSDKRASDDARGMLNALALEKKLPLELASKVFTVPGKGRSSFYRPKGTSNPTPNFPIEVSATHRDRIHSRPTGAKGLGLFVRTERGAKLAELILNPQKIEAIVAYAKKL